MPFLKTTYAFVVSPILYILVTIMEFVSVTLRKECGSRNQAKARLLAAFLFAAIFSQARAADNRLWFRAAAINGKPVRLAFDSGCDCWILPAATASKNGTSVSNAESGSRTKTRSCRMVKPCMVELEGCQTKGMFKNVKLPSDLEVAFDGIIGWWDIQSAFCSWKALLTAFIFI